MSCLRQRALVFEPYPTTSKTHQGLFVVPVLAYLISQPLTHPFSLQLLNQEGTSICASHHRHHAAKLVRYSRPLMLPTMHTSSSKAMSLTSISLVEQYKQLEVLSSQYHINRAPFFTFLPTFHSHHATLFLISLPTIVQMLSRLHIIHCFVPTLVLHSQFSA